MFQVKTRFARLLVAAAVVLGVSSLSLSAHADEKGAIDALNSRVTAVAAQANDAKESAAVANNTAQAAMAAAQQANQRLEQLARTVDELQQQLAATKGKSKGKSPRN